MSDLSSLFGSSAGANEETKNPVNGFFAQTNFEKFSRLTRAPEPVSTRGIERVQEREEKAKEEKLHRLATDERLQEKREKRRLRNVESSTEKNSDEKKSTKISGPVTAKKDTAPLVKKAPEVQKPPKKKAKKEVVAEEKEVEEEVEEESSDEEEEEISPEEQAKRDEEQAKKDEEKAKKDDLDNRTLFVGNVPVKMSTKDVTALFTPYGKVESIRLRSVPVAGTAIDEAGNQALVRKVCVNSGKFGDQKGSVNAYIVFESAESVGPAVAALNNTLVGNRHIRVDSAKPTLFDHTRTVFIGGLPYYADEEEVRKHFAEKLENGQEDIEGIRLVRDPETLVGKGIGYLTFKNRDCIAQALTLHDQPFKKRWNLRVTSCGKRTKKHGGEGGGKKKNKRESVNKSAAKKRIKLKGVETKKKMLAQRKPSRDKKKLAAKNRK